MVAHSLSFFFNDLQKHGKKTGTSFAFTKLNCFKIGQWCNEKVLTGGGGAGAVLENFGRRCNFELG